LNKKYGTAAMAVLAIIFSFFFIPVAEAADPDFGGMSQFRDRWIEQDRLVGQRPYTWGPNVPGAPVVKSEAYNNSPGGQRRVLYLDKARMEINNPANGYVTTGLVVKELVSGLRQDGDTTFTQLAPSNTQVAGDPVSVNPQAPAYASFKNVVTLGNADSKSRGFTNGAVINQFINKSGGVSTINPPETIRVGAYHSQTGHNIAAPFEAFMRQRGPVTNPANGATIADQPVYTADPVSNVFGLAISEPYWVNTKIAGVNRTVLVQLFERRVLTYNPALANNKVEMGNLGQHYYQWRYVETAGPSTPPPVAVTGLDGEESAFLTLINQYRQANGKAALTLNQNLINSSKWLSGDMANKNYFNHTDSQGRDPFKRMSDFGYGLNTYKAENIAAGFSTAAQALDAWKNSPGHNANMLDGNYKVIGIGRAYNPNSVYKWYWTTDFGGQ
jgi:uncharacterized protein YkwD